MEQMTDDPVSLSSELTRKEFVGRGAGLAAVGTGMGLLVPSAWAQGGAKRGGILDIVYSDGAASETTDPTTQLNSSATAIGLNSVYDRLIYVRPVSWAPTPRLATSWEVSPNGRRWTLKLRRGVRFHNGKVLDSKDVAWTLRHILKKRVGSSAYARLSSILDPSGIRTPRADTIVLNLKKPDSLLPLFLGAYQIGIFPDGVDPKEDAIGTGPFMLKSFRPTRGFELTRNPNYWKRGLPYLDGVRAVFIADPNTKLLAVTNGSADLSDPIPFTQVARVAGRSDLKLITLPGAVFHAYAFDSQKEPFTDPRVARAIKMAVNRQALLRAAVQRQGTLTGDVPALYADPFYPPRRGIPKPDIAGAKRLLAAAGHGDGLSFSMSAAEIGPGIVDMVTALKDVLARADIDMTIDRVPIDTYFSVAWKVKPAFVSSWNRRHPHELLSLLYRSGAEWNESNFRSKALDDLLDRGAATQNRAKQRSIYRSALFHVAARSGEGISYWTNRSFAAKRKVNGVAPDPQQMLILEQAWLA
jgi:peptide/nickel transport system substrate-binding protein